MDFFKSVFADDPDPLPPPRSGPESSSPVPASSSSSHPQQQQPSPSDPASKPDPPPHEPTPASTPSSSGAGGGVWSFGGLMKTFATRSESVIETYRRDLKDFGSGLKKETQSLRDVASRAMKELPSSIEISASKAQGAVDSIGSSVWRSTAEIIGQGKESLFATDLDSSDDGNGAVGRIGSNSSAISKDLASSGGRYSRFDAQLRAIQCDVNTYAEEPESGAGGAAGDYEKWRLGFNLGEKEKDIEGLLGGNGAVGEIYKKLVPGLVDSETFWCRYFYRVHRLEQAESVRAKLVKRATSREAEEELSWDVDDDDDEEEEEEKKADGSLKNAPNVPLRGDKLRNEDVNTKDSSKNAKDGYQVISAEDKNQVGSDKREEVAYHGVEEGDKKVNMVEPINNEKVADEKVMPKDASAECQKDEPAKKLNEKVSSETKAEGKEPSQKNDSSVIPKQQTEEEDLEWDEIEDIGSGDEKKVTLGGSSERAEVRKQLSIAMDEEDLSWDIEDDDEPAKA